VIGEASTYQDPLLLLLVSLIVREVVITSAPRSA
jgi:hypothetical protein